MSDSSGRFTVRFQGVRGSYPTPKQENLFYGGNTSCVEINVNNHTIILDAGTGIIPLGERLSIEHIASSYNPYERKPINTTILLSHIHQDHIQGFPFFKPAHFPSTTINILGYSDFDEDLGDTLSDLLFNKSFPLDLGDIAASLNIQNITDDEVIILKPGTQEPVIKQKTSAQDLVPQEEDIVISLLKSYAHPQNGVLSYKISYKDKSVVYATDREGYITGDKKLALFARDCDLLIHDSQYTQEDYSSIADPKQGYGHSTFEMALEMQTLSHSKRLAFFHLEPSYNDTKLQILEQQYQQQSPTCFVAKEGLEIEIL